MARKRFRLRDYKLLSLGDPTLDEIQRKVITWAMNLGFDLDEILSILKEF